MLIKADLEKVGQEWFLYMLMVDGWSVGLGASSKIRSVVYSTCYLAGGGGDLAFGLL
jgi:hypothetical protein